MPFETIFINLGFDELLGLFSFFAVLIYFIIVVFNGVMRLFGFAFEDFKMKKLSKLSGVSDVKTSRKERSIINKQLWRERRR